MNHPTPQNQIILVAPQQALANLSQLSLPGQPAAAVPGSDEPPMIDLAGMWREIRRRWKLIAACSAICGALGLAYALKAPKIYVSQATLEVEQEPTRVLGGAGFGATDVKALEVLKTIEQKLSSPTMLLRVVKANGLDTDPTFAPPREAPYKDDEIVGMLAKRVTVVLSRGTRLIDIRVEDTDPARAKRLAESFLTQSSEIGLEANGKSAEDVRSSLESQKDKIRERLDTAQKAVEDFRNAHPEVPLEEKPTDLKTNIFEDRVKTLSSQISTAREEVVRLENGVAQMKTLSASSAADLLKISAVANDEQVTTLQRAANDKRQKVVELEARYLPKWPPLIRAKQEVAAAEKSVELAAQTVAQVMANRLAQAKNNVEQLQRDLSQAKQDGLKFQKIASDFGILTDELRVQQEHYKQVLTRLKEAEVSQAFAGNILKVAGVPMEPTNAERPRRKLIVGGAGLAGLMLGVGLALFLRLLDRTMHNLPQGEKDLSLPGLAALPRCEEADERRQLLTNPATSLESAEAFRALRTSLALLGKGVNARSFLFTSANPGDGKSYCARNFAVALAQQGYRTLLIDADLRQPGQDEVLLGRRNAAGLVSHLKGAAGATDKACNPTIVPNLFLFSAGESEDAHPAELLSGQAFRELLGDALQWFHKIVIDTPPINAVTDALLLAREVDSVAFIVKAGVTPKSDARHAISKLHIAGNRPVGFILNAASPEALSAGYTGDFSFAQPTAYQPLLLSPGGAA